MSQQKVKIHALVLNIDFNYVSLDHREKLRITAKIEISEILVKETIYQEFLELSSCQELFKKTKQIFR